MVAPTRQHLKATLQLCKCAFFSMYSHAAKHFDVQAMLSFAHDCRENGTRKRISGCDFLHAMLALFVLLFVCIALCSHVAAPCAGAAMQALCCRNSCTSICQMTRMSGVMALCMLPSPAYFLCECKLAEGGGLIPGTDPLQCEPVQKLQMGFVFRFACPNDGLTQFEAEIAWY